MVNWLAANASTIAVPSISLANLWPSQSLVERRHPLPQRLDVLPDPLAILPVLVVLRPRWDQPQICLQIAERAGEILEVIGEQTAVAQLADRRRIDRDQHVGDVARLRGRMHLHVDA